MAEYVAHRTYRGILSNIVIFRVDFPRKQSSLSNKKLLFFYTDIKEKKKIFINQLINLSIHWQHDMFIIKN